MSQSLTYVYQQKVADHTTHQPLKLPTISDAFFYKPRVQPFAQVYLSEPGFSPQGGASDSYIFFDPALNLEPNLLQAEDFVTRPPTPLPLPIPEPATAEMPKPLVNYDSERNFTSLASIKEKSTLADEDFKKLHSVAKDFVRNNENECKKTPRLWKRDNWKALAIRLVDGGLGTELWNNKRKGFTTSDDLLYPGDKIAIAFITFAVIKLESEKAFRVSKRKSSASVAEGDSSLATSAKKAKQKQPSEETEEADDEADGNVSEEKDENAPVTPAIEKAKVSQGKGKGKGKATPKSATKAKATPAQSGKRKIARIKSPAREPSPADSSTTNEDEKTGEYIGEYSILKRDPFNTARAFAQDPAFSRESLVGKPGVSFAADPNAEPPTYQMPQVTKVAALGNEFFGFYGIDPAPRGMTIGDATEAGYRDQSELADDMDDEDNTFAEDSTVIDHTLGMSSSRVDGLPLSDHVTASYITSNPMTVAGLLSPESPSVVGTTHAITTTELPPPAKAEASVVSNINALLPPQSAAPLLNAPVTPKLSNITPMEGHESSPAIAPSASIASTSAFGPTLTFSITVASNDIPQMVTLPATTTFTNLMQHVREAYNGDDSALENLTAAKSCIITLAAGDGKPLKRQVNLNAQGLETSWKAVMKKVLATIADPEDDEVEMKFR